MEAATVTEKAEGHAPASGTSFPSTSPRRIQPSPVPYLQSERRKSCQRGHDFSFQSVYSNGLLIGLHLHHTHFAVSVTKRLSDTITLPWHHMASLDISFLTVTQVLNSFGGCRWWITKVALIRMMVPDNCFCF